jgi:hypothetical protein
MDIEDASEVAQVSGLSLLFKLHIITKVVEDDEGIQ